MTIKTVQINNNKNIKKIDNLIITQSDQLKTTIMIWQETTLTNF